MAFHTKTDIHYWCVEQDRIADLNEKIKQENEVKGSEIIVTSAVQCLKELDGSLKFVRTNNLLEILNKDSPTKNDGRQMFFTIRELLFEKICTTIKQKFQSIQSACFTLDKVTVRRTPFTVIMSYFFSGGRIHVVLNSVHKMRQIYRPWKWRDDEESS